MLNTIQQHIILFSLSYFNLYTIHLNYVNKILNLLIKKIIHKYYLHNIL